MVHVREFEMVGIWIIRLHTQQCIWKNIINPIYQLASLMVALLVPVSFEMFPSVSVLIKWPVSPFTNMD